MTRSSSSNSSAASYELLRQRKYELLATCRYVLLHHPILILLCVYLHVLSECMPVTLAFVTSGSGLDTSIGVPNLFIGHSFSTRIQHRHRQAGWLLFQDSRSNHSDDYDHNHNIDQDTTSKKRKEPKLKLDRKPKQKRRKIQNPRRPRAFWKDIHNIQNELRLFWSSVNVDINPSQPPPIPNEALLNHFERHDLRYAIANMGGRNIVATQLGNATLVPGKWSDAIQQSDEVKQLLKKDNIKGKGLSKAVPPIARHVKRTLVKGEVKKVKKHMHDMIMNSFLHEDASIVDLSSSIVPGDLADIVIPLQESINRGGENILDMDIEELNDETLRRLRYPSGERWAQNAYRKPRGYWDQDVLLTELFEYQSYAEEAKGRPSIWMARPSEMSDEGRNDLRQAIGRFGGTDHVCSISGLVPYKEWRHFESQLELSMELQAYLNQYGSEHSVSLSTANYNSDEDGNEDEETKIVFPKMRDLLNNGHDRLHDLIMDFGGRKIVAIKLDMDFQQAQTKLKTFQGISLGKFDLTFCIDLMLYTRKKMMTLEPVIDEDGISSDGCSHIQMPTIQELLEDGEDQLAEGVEKYGGHECIARRLDFHFDSKEAKKDASIGKSES
jgi:hypothetical protein